MRIANIFVNSVCGLLFSTACAATPDSSNPTTVAPMNAESKRLTPFPEIKCAPTSKSDSAKTLNAIEAWQEANLQTLRGLSDPEMIGNEVRLTSAGLLSDETPMITVDRDCWSEFFTAFSNSIFQSKTSENRSAKTKEAKAAADAWMVCIKARQPELLEEAKKIRACLP